MKNDRKCWWWCGQRGCLRRELQMQSTSSASCSTISLSNGCHAICSNFSSGVSNKPTLEPLEDASSCSSNDEKLSSKPRKYSSDLHLTPSFSHGKSNTPSPNWDSHASEEQPSFSFSFSFSFSTSFINFMPHTSLLFALFAFSYHSFSLSSSSSCLPLFVFCCCSICKPLQDLQKKKLNQTFSHGRDQTQKLRYIISRSFVIEACMHAFLHLRFIQRVMG